MSRGNDAASTRLSSVSHHWARPSCWQPGVLKGANDWGLSVPNVRGEILALLYRRVSSDEQAREGVSLAAQSWRTRTYAARQGFLISGEYADVLSGTRSDRPQYQEMLLEVGRQCARRRP